MCVAAPVAPAIYPRKSRCSGDLAEYWHFPHGAGQQHRKLFSLDFNVWFGRTMETIFLQNSRMALAQASKIKAKKGNTKKQRKRNLEAWEKWSGHLRGGRHWADSLEESKSAFQVVIHLPGRWSSSQKGQGYMLQAGGDWLGQGASERAHRGSWVEGYDGLDSFVLMLKAPLPTFSWKWKASLEKTHASLNNYKNGSGWKCLETLSKLSFLKSGMQ